jgi:hypothetical protein
MQASGSNSYSEFARMALLDKCRAVEADLLKANPAEYARLYEGNPFYQGSGKG